MTSGKTASPPSSPPGTYVRCDGIDAPVLLHSGTWIPGLTAEAKQIAGRTWNTKDETHRWPFAQLPKVLALADKHRIPVPPQVRALTRVIEQRAAALATRPRKAGPSVYIGKDGLIAIAADADDTDLAAALRDLNNDRPTWNPDRQVHEPPTNDPERLLDICNQFELGIADDARTLLETETARQAATRDEARAAAAPPLPIPGLAANITLKPHQYAGVRWMVKYRAGINADEMGLGKTLEAGAAIAVDRAFPAVVVCPSSLRLNWLEEINKCFPLLNAWIAETQTPCPVPADTDIVIIGSNLLGYTPARRDDAEQGVEPDFPWLRPLRAIRPKALIIDEGQEVKEEAAYRSQAAALLGPQVRERGGLVFVLSGTPAPNRVVELANALDITGRIEEFGGRQAFRWRYALSSVNEYGQGRYDGATRHVYDGELRDRLLKWGIMLRRTKDVLDDELPSCTVEALHIPRDLLDPQIMAEYDRAAKDIIDYLVADAVRLAHRMGVSPDDAAVEAKVKAGAARHLVRLNTLSRLVAQAKRDYVTAWVRERTAAGVKVVVAAHHRHEVGYYARQFGGLTIIGKQSAESVQEHKHRFQTDPDAKVMTVSITAGGVGHTLTAAHTGIGVEYPWRPGDISQMISRIHRIGLDHPVTWWTTIAADTVDEDKHTSVTAKQKALDAAVDGICPIDPNDETPVLADVVWALTRRGFGGRA